ncbi:MAG: phytanoyl-CoA dioxygenase family protein, partial [Gammaproteobacteria bacterium]
MVRVQKDPLDALDIDGEPSAVTIDVYRRDGFVRLRALLDPDEVARRGAEITRLTLALNTQTRPLAERTTYDRTFLQVMNLWRESARVREFVYQRQLAAVAARLLGVRAVRLYHDQSLYQEPSGGMTPAHADQYCLPFASDKVEQAVTPVVEEQVVEDLVGRAALGGRHPGDGAVGGGLVVDRLGERVHAVVAGVDDGREALGLGRQVLGHDLGPHLGVGESGDAFGQGERPHGPVRRREVERAGRAVQADEHTDGTHADLGPHGRPG